MGKPLWLGLASQREQRWGIVGASGGVALGRIPLAKRPEHWTGFPNPRLAVTLPNVVRKLRRADTFKNTLIVRAVLERRLHGSLEAKEWDVSED